MRDSIVKQPEIGSDSGFASGIKPEGGYGPRSLFDGFSEEELAHVLAGGYVLTCRRGDTLLIAGDVEHAIFVILGGRVEIVVEGEVVAVEGAGCVVGEIAYLLRGARTAAVVSAADDVRVRYLRYREAETWLRDDPGLAARLFWNLGRILAVKRVALRH